MRTRLLFAVIITMLALPLLSGTGRKAAISPDTCFAQCGGHGNQGNGCSPQVSPTQQMAINPSGLSKGLHGQHQEGDRGDLSGAASGVMAIAAAVLFWLRMQH